MRASAAWLAFLAACSGAGFLDEPDDPAVLGALLGSDHPLKREEAAHRLSLLGRTVHEAVAGRPQVEALVDQDTASMRAGLAGALEERDAGRIVRQAYHALRGGCLGREWSRVSDALARQRFRLIEIYEPHERAKFVRFLAQGSAYVNGAGDKHDLFFWVQSGRAGDRWVVREVYVGLHVTFEAAFKLLAAQQRYPRGSVLARFFEAPAVAKLAIVFPVLEEIELTYGWIRDKESEIVPAGFHINAGFAMAGEGKGGGRGVYYTVESGLDPRATRRGRLLWDGFVPDPTPGPLVLRGSSFWGAGGLKPSDE